MNTSHAQILRSSAIIGFASVIGVLLGIVRLRIAATAVGPVGIGVIGLLQNFVMFAGTLAAMGIGNGAARQIAAALGGGKDGELASVKRTLWIAGLALALIGGIFAWLVSAFASAEVISSDALATDAPLLGIAAALSVIAAVQTGLLTGSRRLGDIARVNIVTGLLATVVVALAFPLWPERAIIIFVVATPLLTVMVGQCYLVDSNLLPSAGIFSSRQLKAMLAIGSAMTTSAILALGTALFVRGLVQDRLGEIDLGLFQAAWVVASMYLGIVLHAMATDYLPRLSEASGDPARLTRLVNEQAEVLLLTAGPIILSMVAAAPLVMVLLYGPDFTTAAGLLRIQLVGDVFKLLGWPLGFVLLALAASRRFIIIEIICIGAFPVVTWLLIDAAGIHAAGWGYAAMFVIGLPLSYWAVKRRVPEFRWDRRVLADGALLLFAAALLSLLTPDDLVSSGIVGAGAGSLAGWRSYRRLSSHFPDLAAALRARLSRAR